MPRRCDTCRRCGIKYGALSDFQFSADKCTKAFNIPAKFERGSDGKCTVCSKVKEGHWYSDYGELHCYDSNDHFQNGYKRCCLHYFGPKDEFETEACDRCKTRANEVEQFEHALAQNVSEAPQKIRQFISEHTATAQQYAVKVKRAKANILLASETGRAL